jgi:hypothetical protein
MAAADHAHDFKTRQGRGGGFHGLEATCRKDHALERAMIRFKGLCCTDRLVNALSPPPACGLGDADGLRASKLEHAVQDFDGDGRLGSTALIRP